MRGNGSSTSTPGDRARPRRISPSVSVSTSSRSTKLISRSSCVNSSCAVGALRLVPPAAGDLVVAVEAAAHQQLLVELRALRQRVERARARAGPGPGSRARPRASRASSSASRGREPALLEEAAHRAHGVARGSPAIPAFAGGAGRGSGGGCAAPRRRSRRRAGRAAPRSSESSSSSSTASSTSPVGELGRCASPRCAARARRARARRTRAAAPCATACASGERSGSITSCTMPVRSRRSMKTSPPWSRRRPTQPESVSSRPASLGARLAAQHVPVGAHCSAHAPLDVVHDDRRTRSRRLRA